MEAGVDDVIRKKLSLIEKRLEENCKNKLSFVLKTQEINIKFVERMERLKTELTEHIEPQN